MQGDPQSYNMAVVRDLLLAAFTPENLRRLFLYTDQAALRPLTQEFAPADGLAAMVDKAIIYCQTRALLPELLAEVEKANPRQFTRFRDRLTGGAEAQIGQAVIRDSRGVAIGDSSVIYQYFLDERYRPLAEHLIAFDDLLARRTRDFVGRQFVDDWLLQFLETHDRGYFVLVGVPGVGKTAWAAHVVRQYNAIHHFNVATLGLTRPDQALENLCAQLIARCKLDHPGHLPLTAGRDGSYLNRLLHQAADRLEGDKLLLVIDALNEVQMPAGDRGVNVLYLPASLPPGVYVVLTCLPKIALETDPDTSLETWTLGADLPDNKRDVETYLRAQAQKPGIADWLKAHALHEDRFVAEMAERSGGNFMYLAYLLADIEAGEVQALALSELPRGLLGYFERFWGELEMAKGEGREAWLRFYKPVIGLLAAVREPVGATWMGRVLGLDADEVHDFALVRWSRFLNCAWAGGEERWRVYDGSFASFLRTKLQGAREYHRRIAEHYLATYASDWRRCDDYGLKHIIEHIVAAGLPDEEQTAALDRVLTDQFVEAVSERFDWLWHLAEDLDVVAGVDPARAAAMALKIIEGPMPNSLVIQRLLRLLVRLHPEIGFVGNRRSSRHRNLNEAIEIASHWPDAAKRWRDLLEKVKDPRSQSIVALALGETGNREVAASVLLQMLKTGRRERSWAAADALIALNDPAVIPDLIRWYDEGYSHRDRERVVYILGWLHVEEARTLLPRALAAPDSKIVGRAVDLLWQLQPAAGDLPFLMERLEQILNSDPRQPKALGPWADEWVQKRLVRVLSKRGGPGVVPYLEKLLDHIARRPTPTGKDVAKRSKLVESVENALRLLGGGVV